MQKKILALAVAGLVSGAAFAQSNVTVYGIVDAAAVGVNTSNYTNGSVRQHRGVDDGLYASRLGFKGEEGLGGGLKAIFVTEYGIKTTNSVAGSAADDTNYAMFTRQSYLGLDSASVGQFIMGRIQGPSYEFGVASRPMGVMGDSHRAVSNAVGISMHSGDRMSNAMQYTTPTWGGFRAKALYSSDYKAEGEQNDNSYWNKKGRTAVWQGAAQFQWAGLDTMAVYRRQLNADEAEGDGGNYQWGLVASYDFKFMKIGANYQELRSADAVSTVPQFGGPARSAQDAALWGGYVTVPVGKFDLMAQFHKSSADDSVGAKAYALGTVYNLSKRTKVYGLYSHAHMGGNTGKAGPLGTVGTGTALGLGNTITLDAGQSADVITLGVAHSF